MAEKEFTQICKEILALGKRIEAMDFEELRQIEVHVKAIQVALDSSKSDFDSKYAQLHGLESALRGYETSLNNIKSEIEAKASEINQAVSSGLAKISEADSIKDEVVSKLERVESALARADEGISRLDALKSKIYQELQNKSNEMKLVAQNAVATVETRQQQATQDIADQTRKLLDFVQEKMCCWYSKRDEVINELDKKAQEIIKQVEDVKLENRQIDDYMDRLEEAKQEVDQVRQSADEIKQKEQELTELKDKLNELKDDIQTVSSDGLIDDKKPSLIKVYSSKKVETLIDINSPSVPVGAVVEYPEDKELPIGFKVLDGSSLDKSEYAELYEIIGDKFGSDESSFNLPTEQIQQKTNQDVIDDNNKGTNKTYSSTKIESLISANNSTIPVGTIFNYPKGQTLPKGFKALDGASLSKAEYADLFNVLGEGFSIDDDNFALPKNQIEQTSLSIDLSKGNNFVIKPAQSEEMSLNNATVGQTGTIVVTNSAMITNFNNKLKFKTQPKGMSGVETFNYYVLSSDDIKIHRY
ncbi:putative chromosome segregation protein [Campylobacter pinnipediorum subsp. caledonicus]|uniref:Putative chromosome segregation protein n=1 Tax=Campylobacter pinnipediorum subsp. caledonicus TaxID=1874362 RepID=A0A1S6U5W3_9BACT|nr:phage tail protein [Campylobacter pinnipediorum]AQW87103.1 putative chromosome segregation protein [Campylobacter pinnipediorum subsp. caledonicus]